jgi:hypothetical protein
VVTVLLREAERLFFKYARMETTFHKNLCCKINYQELVWVSDVSVNNLIKYANLLIKVELKISDICAGLVLMCILFLVLHLEDEDDLWNINNTAFIYMVLPHTNRICKNRIVTLLKFMFIIRRE